MNRAFTLIEFLVVGAIMSIMMGSGITTTVQTIQKKNLEKATARVENTIVQARDYALAGRKIQCPATETLDGWRVLVESNTYSLFEMCSNGSFLHDSGSFTTDPNITLVGGDQNIVFKPLGQGAQSVYGVILTGHGFQKEIEISPSGQIEKSVLGQSVPTSTPAPTPVAFSGLSANLNFSQATYTFTYAGAPAASFAIDMSTVANMSTDVYMTFANGTVSPVSIASPTTRWGKYVCGATLYWRVRTPDGLLSSIQTSTVVCTSTPVPTATNTPIPTATPTTASGQYTGLAATLGSTQASYTFTYTGAAASSHTVNMSTVSNMSTDVYVNFASGASSPVTVASPTAKWNKYVCGATLYWRVSTPAGVTSPIQTSVVNCPVNLILNGSFENTGGSPWYTPWGVTVNNSGVATFTQNTANFTHGTKSMAINITTPSTVTQGVQLRQAGLALTGGGTRTFSFRAKASAARSISVGVQMASSPFTVYASSPSSGTVNLTTSWQLFTFTVTPPNDAINDQIYFNMGLVAGTVYIDDVQIY
jgi:Tfp pilus assembly protein FimT